MFSLGQNIGLAELAKPSVRGPGAQEAQETKTQEVETRFMLCSHECFQHALHPELAPLRDIPGRAAGTVRMVCRRESSRRQVPFMYMFSPQALCTVGPQAWGQRPAWVRGAPEHAPFFSLSPSLLGPPRHSVSPSRPSRDPETLTNSWERWVEAARDRPRDMSTASEVAERADTQGHTHGYTLTRGTVWAGS